MKRENKNKAQIEAEMKQQQKVKNDKILVKLLFPFIENMKSIYDAQTALSAMSGYIKASFISKTDEIRVKDLTVDLSKEEDTEITTAMKHILEQLQEERAEDMTDLLDRFANILPKIGANEFLKGPMSTLKITDILTD